jgi:N-acetylglucosamine-6-phosphate deacetylase
MKVSQRLHSDGETLVFRGRAVLPDSILDEALIVCREGRIEAVRRGQRLPRNARVVDAGRGWILPGFIDIHVHGGGGADYMDGSADAVKTVNRAHLRSGTTTIFPTTTTGSPAQVRRMLDACMEVRRNWTPADGARIGGVHLYGPYFAKSKVGCHAPEGRRDPLAAEYEDYFRLGIVKIATCAAELPGAAAFYRTARRRGCLVTCGHSNSSWQEMEDAFQAGVRHVDHFWCAMSSVPSLRDRFGTPMQASMAEFVLARPDMSTEVIADGEHLSKELLRFAYVMKGPRRLCLVTDANRALGMPAGRYRFGPLEDGAWFESNGKVGFIPGSGLASSVFALDTMVRNMKAMTGAPLVDVVRMATLTPAERAGVAEEVGSLEPGKRADVLIADARLKVRRVYVGAEEIEIDQWTL